MTSPPPDQHDAILERVRMMMQFTPQGRALGAELVRVGPSRAWGKAPYREELVGDPETGVIRVYDDELQPTHQRHALDLLQDAAQLQLIADLPPFNAAPGSLVIDNKGNIAFNISGVVCVTTLKQLDALPRPQPLL